MAAGFERQVAARRAYAFRCPGWTDSVTLYRRQLAEHASPRSRILDLGCGRLGLHSDDIAFASRAEVIGVDPDHAALARNAVIPARVVATGESLPFTDAMFDIVASAWVLEHLALPGTVFAEVHRVLRPGGSFVFLTPNAWNYNAWLIRAVPNRWHGWFTERLYGRATKETYPTLYRANSASTLRRLLLAAGFRDVQFVFNGDPSYVAFNPLLYEVAVAAESLLSVPRLRNGRVHILGVARR
jgi:SAM-dependent methyltransferase